MKKIKAKKSLIITTIIGSILTLLLVIFEISNFYLLFFKINFNIVTSTEFSKIMEEAGCKIVDAKSQHETKGIDTYLVTDENNCPYLISYTSFNDKNEQIDFFNSLAKDVNDNNENVTGNTSVNFPDYVEYDTSGKFYKSVTVQKNVIIYASVDKEYREPTRKLLEKMDCKYVPNWKYAKRILYSSPLIVLDIIFIVYMIIKWDRVYTMNKKGKNK